MKRSSKTDAPLESERVTSEYFAAERRSKRVGLLGNCDIPVIPVEDGQFEPAAKKRVKRMTKSAANQEGTLGISRLLHTSAPHNWSTAVELQPLTAGPQRFRTDFYDVPCKDLAKQLLGQVLVRQLDDGTTLSGMIVETECYLGGEDKASHSYNGRMTERSKPMYMKPGTAYVYMTYGMYHMFNISSQEPGAAVLLRALEPLQGHDEMIMQRLTNKKKPREPINVFSSQLENNGVAIRRSKGLKPHELCNGPAKLCTSLMIDKSSCNTQDLSVWPNMWIEKSPDDTPIMEHHIVKTSRIGIDSAGIEWASKPLRFYIIGKPSVSRRDLSAEMQLKEIAALLNS